MSGAAVSKKRKTGDTAGNKKKHKAQKVSWEDIKFVQNLIERCLLQYMTQAEIITALQAQANIDPAFTCLVWEKLLDQNRDFFYLYGIKLRLKDQVVAFNYLVDQHVQLLKTGLSGGIPPRTLLANESSRAGTSSSALAAATTSGQGGNDTDKFFA
jgi:uncharacterized protein (TIGR01589 family)